MSRRKSAYLESERSENELLHKSIEPLEVLPPLRIGKGVDNISDNPIEPHVSPAINEKSVQNEDVIFQAEKFLENEEKVNFYNDQLESPREIMETDVLDQAEKLLRKESQPDDENKREDSTEYY